MSISDAQFAAFLQNDGERKVLLAELDVIYSGDSIGSPANEPFTATIYLADYPYNTRPGEADGRGVSWDGLIYRECIESTPAFSQSIDPGTLGGKTTYSIGSLVLTNTDGEQDGLLDNIIDGQECRFYLGSPSWARADFRNVLTAIAQRITIPSQDKISIELRDRGLLLNTDIVGTDIGGTGPNAGQPLPIILGFCNNVELPLIDATTLVYGVADTSADPIEVYDSGFALVQEVPKLAALGSAFTVDTVNDTITHPDLNLAVDDILTILTGATMGLVSGAAYFVNSADFGTHAFSLSATRGGPTVDLTSTFISGETVNVNRYPSLDNLDVPRTITISHAPFGRITCDVDGPVGGGSPSDASRASDLIYELAVNRGGVPSANFSGPLESFAEDDDACDFHLGRAVIARENMTGVLDDVLFSVNGFWGFDQFSNFIYGRIRPQDIGAWLGSPLPDVFQIGSDDIVDIASISLEHLAPTYDDARGYFQKSWASQTDGFAGGVPLDRISYLQNGGLFFSDSETDPLDEGYLANPSRYHRTMVSSPDYVTLLSQQTCALAFAEFQTWLHDRRLQAQPYLEILALKTGLGAINLKLGDVVEVTLDRFGFDAGVLFQVLSIAVDLTAQEITLSMIHRKIPDYSQP